MPDGSDPYRIIQTWTPFVIDCLRLLDGDGTYRHWKYGSDYSKQPWIDLQIYDAIKAAYAGFKNRKSKEMIRKSKVSPASGGHRKPYVGRRR